MYANCLALLGHTGAETSVTFGQWLDLIDPSDRPLVIEKFKDTRAHRPDNPLVIEMRLCQRDGGCRWFFMSADWYKGDNGPYALNGVSVDIQNLKSTSDELRAPVDKLKEADVRKDEFLAMLAHELRNPLAPIRSAAELLKIV